VVRAVAALPVSAKIARDLTHLAFGGRQHRSVIRGFFDFVRRPWSGESLL